MTVCRVFGLETTITKDEAFGMTLTRLRVQNDGEDDYSFGGEKSYGKPKEEERRERVREEDDYSSKVESHMERR